MSEPSDNAPGRHPRRDPVSALNALDLALGSQQIESEMAEFLVALLPLLDAVEKICRDLHQKPAEVLAAKAEQLALLPELADEAMGRIGLSRFGAPGEAVDRARHEVVDTLVDESRPAGTILDVLEPGWAHQGRILRYAKVIASVKPAKASR